MPDMWQPLFRSQRNLPVMDLESALRDTRMWPVFLLSDLNPDRLEALLEALTARGLGDNVTAARAANVLLVMNRLDDALSVTALHADGLAYAQQMLVYVQQGTPEAYAQILAGRRAVVDNGTLDDVPCGWEAQMRLEYALASAYDSVQARPDAVRHYERAAMIAEGQGATSMRITIEASRIIRETGDTESILTRLIGLLAQVRAEGPWRNRVLESYLIARIVAAHALRSDYVSVLRVAQELDEDAPERWMYGCAQTCISFGVSEPPPLDCAPGHPLMQLAHALHLYRTGLGHLRMLAWDKAAAPLTGILDLRLSNNEDWPVVNGSLRVLVGLAHLGLGDLHAATSRLRGLIAAIDDAPSKSLARVFTAAYALELLAHGGALIPELEPRAALRRIEEGFQAVPAQMRPQVALSLVELMPHAAEYACTRAEVPALNAAVSSRLLRVGESGATFRGVDARRYPSSDEQLDIMRQTVMTRGEVFRDRNDNNAAQTRKRHREAVFNLGTPPIAYCWRVALIEGFDA